jgi:hypothetical protein
VGGEKEAGVCAEGCQESGDLGLMGLGAEDLGLKDLGLKDLGLKDLGLIDMGFRREGLTKVGGGNLKLEDLGFNCHDLAVTG